MRHEYRDEVRSRLSSPDDIHDRIHTLHIYIQEHLQQDPRHCRKLADEALVLAKTEGDLPAIAQSLTDLARCYQALNDYPKARTLYNEALALFEELQDYTAQVFILRSLGWISKLEGDYDRSLGEYTRGLVHAEAHGNKIGAAQCLNGLGSLYGAMGDYIKAIDCYQRSLYLRSELNDGDLGAVYTNIGNMHHRLGNYQQALDYYHKRLKLCEASEPDATRALTLQNVGATLHHLDQQDEAERYTRQALALYEKLGDRTGMARCLANVGCVLQMRSQLDEAGEFYKRALAIAEEIGDYDTITGSLTNLGTLHTMLSMFDEAADYLQRALALAEKSGNRRAQSEVYMHLSEALEKHGKYAESLAYYKQFNALNNELLGREKHMAMHELQYRFDVEKLEQEKEIYRLKNVELAQALAEVEKLNAHLRHMDTEKSELLGVVVHDLKSPLSNILMLAQILSRNHNTITPADIYEFAGDIETVAHRMMELIINLLDADSMESGHMQLHAAAVDMVSMVAGVLSQYRERAAAKSILLHIDMPQHAVVLADATALTRVVDNLVSNAIKYSPPDSNVYVSVQVQPQSARCTVRDEGPGMTPEDMDRLFGRFARLSARPTGGEHSTGLGLSIVKKLVEAMHGDIRCESEHGKGASFILDLPLAIAQ